MGESVSVPVLLVGSMDALRVLNRPEVTVVKAATLGEAIQKRGEIECPAEIAVLDMESGTRTDVVVAGLLMRNAGRSVVICQLTTLPLEEAGQAQGAQHRGELMGQFHRDRSSSAPGLGKKVVQGRAWRGGTVGAPAATGVRLGRGLAVEGMDENRLHGVVAILADGEGASAGGIQPGGAVALGQAL